MSQHINDYDTALARVHYKQKALRRLRLLARQHGEHTPPEPLRRHIGENRHWLAVAERQAQVTP